MATCSTIAELIQAYVDRQLSLEERTVVETHIAECPDCAILLDELHEVTVAMVEGLATKRVSTTFVERVVAALPHAYEHAPVDTLVEINKRAKRQRLLHKISHMLPYAAAAVLIIAMVLLMAVWPEQDLGFVAKVTNPAKLMRSGRSAAEEAAISIGDIIYAGDTFVADAESRLILAFRTTEIKINGGSMLRVVSEREVELIKGELFADVTSTGSPFRVKLGTGEVTVMGTRFIVKALEDKTVVTVAEGNVLFKSGAGYSEVKAGAQSVSVAGGLPTRAKPVEVQAVTEWADKFVVTPEDVALAKNRGADLPLRRYKHLLPRTRGQVVPAQTLAFFDVPKGPFSIRYVAVRRDAFGTVPKFPPGSRFAIHVSDAHMKKLASINESYSIFDGSSEYAVLTLRPPVTLDGIFHIIFQPYVESELWPGDMAAIRQYTPIPDIENNLQPLSELPAMEGASDNIM